MKKSEGRGITCNLCGFLLLGFASDWFWILLFELSSCLALDLERSECSLSLIFPFFFTLLITDCWIFEFAFMNFFYTSGSPKITPRRGSFTDLKLSILAFDLGFKKSCASHVWRVRGKIGNRIRTPVSGITGFRPLVSGSSGLRSGF